VTCKYLHTDVSGPRTVTVGSQSSCSWILLGLGIVLLPYLSQSIESWLSNGGLGSGRKSSRDEDVWPPRAFRASTHRISLIS